MQKAYKVFFTTLPHSVHNSFIIGRHTRKSRAAANGCSRKNNLNEVKMFRFGFLFRFLLALLVIGELVAVGVAIFSLGWAQGYQTSVLLSNKTAAPAAAWGWPSPAGSSRRTCDRSAWKANSTRAQLLRLRCLLRIRPKLPDRANPT